MGFRCPVCKQDFGKNQEGMLRHLEKKHSEVNLLEQLTKDIDRATENVKKIIRGEGLNNG